METTVLEEMAALFSNRRKQTKSMRNSFKKIASAAKKPTVKSTSKAKRTGTKGKVHGNSGKPKSEAHRLAISRALKKHYAGKKKAQPARTKTGKIKTDKKTLANAHSKLNAIEKRAKARKANKNTSQFAKRDALHKKNYLKAGVARSKAWAKRKEASAALSVAKLEHKAQKTKRSAKRLAAAQNKHKIAKHAHEMSKENHQAHKKVMTHLKIK